MLKAGPMEEARGLFSNVGCVGVGRRRGLFSRVLRTDEAREGGGFRSVGSARLAGGVNSRSLAVNSY